MVVKKDKLSVLRYVSIRDAMYNLTIVSTVVSNTGMLLRANPRSSHHNEKTFFFFLISEVILMKGFFN